MKRVFFAILLTINLVANPQNLNDENIKNLDLSTIKIGQIDINSSSEAKNNNLKQKIFLKKDDMFHVEQSIINDLNKILNQKNIKIKEIKKDPKTNILNIYINANNGNEEFILTLKKFNWGYTQDEKNIVLEDMDIVLNIPWMDYLIKDSLVKNNGYVILANDKKIANFLENIKPAIKINYIKSKI